MEKQWQLSQTYSASFYWCILTNHIKNDLFLGKLGWFPMLPSTGVLVNNTVKHGGHSKRFWIEMFFHDILLTIASKLKIFYKIYCIIIKIITNLFLKCCNIKFVCFYQIIFWKYLSKPPDYTLIRAVNTVLVLHVSKKNCLCFAS